MPKYIGVTIGPIFDTVDIAPSPAALWAASYIFSSVSKTVCELLTTGDKKINCKDIISPYYDPDYYLLKKNNGIGLFHDRIIFRADNYDINDFADVRNAAITRIAADFGLREDYLKDYIMISAVKYETDSPILKLGKMLDSMELSKPFVFEEKDGNPLISLFINDEAEAKADPGEEVGKVGRNEAVKKLISGFEPFQLRKLKKKDKPDESILKSIWDIAHTKSGTKLKKYKYYAIVRSDGDNMTQIIRELEDNVDNVREFSKKCLEFCSDVADEAAKFDGVTIYAGGDDLLAILPCESRDGKTPFDFVHAANGLFKKHFDTYKKNTSLSFGITMAYYKFPLYEAMQDSAYQLFDIAKDSDRKNGVSIKLQKHSGQSEGLFIKNDSLSEIISILERVKEKQSDMLVSAVHKLETFKTMFNNAADRETVHNMFDNIFDAEYHNGNEFLHEFLAEKFLKLQNGEMKVSYIDNDGIHDDNAAKKMVYILRMMKFFIEKEGEK